MDALKTEAKSLGEKINKVSGNVNKSSEEVKQLSRTIDKSQEDLKAMVGDMEKINRSINDLSINDDDDKSDNDSFHSADDGETVYVSGERRLLLEKLRSMKKVKPNEKGFKYLDRVDFQYYSKSNKRFYKGKKGTVVGTTLCKCYVLLDDQNKVTEAYIYDNTNLNKIGKVLLC